MSAVVRLSSKLPADEEINGLDVLAPDLEFDKPICAIVWLQKTKHTIVASGDEIPTVEIARIEPIGELSQVPQSVIKLASKLYEGRTGRTALPFDELADRHHGDVEVETGGGEVLPFAGRSDVTKDVFVAGGEDDE